MYPHQKASGALPSLPVQPEQPEYCIIHMIVAPQKRSIASILASDRELQKLPKYYLLCRPHLLDQGGGLQRSIVIHFVAVWPRFTDVGNKPFGGPKGCGATSYPILMANPLRGDDMLSELPHQRNAVHCM